MVRSHYAAIFPQVVLREDIAKIISLADRMDSAPQLRVSNEIMSEM